MEYQVRLEGCKKSCYARGVAQTDETIGENLQNLRGAMSQAALAAAMKARGWKWSQPTVAAIEKGERSLKLAEATDLLEVLGLESLEDLILRPLHEVGSALLTRFVKARSDLATAVGEFWDAQFGLVGIADAIHTQDEELPGGSEFWTIALTLDPADVIREVAPRVPMRVETVEALADWKQNYIWAHTLASGPYGRASALGDANGAPADSAE